MKKTLILALISVLFQIDASLGMAAKKTDDIRLRLDAQSQEIENLKKEMAEIRGATVKKDEIGMSGYDHGFFIKSRDDNYSFIFRMFAQFFYEYQHNEDAADTNSFGIRRARLLWSGNIFSPKLTYMIMPELVSAWDVPITTTAATVSDGANVTTLTITDRTEENFRLLYLWAQYRIADEFQLRIGEFIPPTEFFLRASNLLEFGNFPIITTTEPFNAGFHTGLDLLGTIAKKLDYEAFAVNGSNFDRINANKSFRIGLCLTYNLLGRPGLGVADVDYSQSPQFALTFSGAYERADWTLAAPANVNPGDTAIRGQTNAVFRYKGFSFVPQFIIFYDHTQHFKHYALAAQTGYFIIPKHLEAAAQANLLKFNGPKNDRYELSAGLNYYFFGHPVKLQADYSPLINQRTGNLQINHRIRVGTQVGFF